MSNCTCAFPCGGTEETCPSSPGYGQLVRGLLAERRQMDRTLSACANERDALRAQLAALRGAAGPIYDGFVEYNAMRFAPCKETYTQPGTGLEVENAVTVRVRLLKALGVVLTATEPGEGPLPTPKPRCGHCGDTGQIMVGRSGDANDGNAPIMEPCEDCAGRVLKLEEIVAELERYSGTPDGPVLELLQRVAYLNEDLKRGKHKSLITQRVFAINEVLWPIAIEYPE